MHITDQGRTAPAGGMCEHPPAQRCQSQCCRCYNDAVDNDSPAVVATLVQYKANLDTKNKDGLTPFMASIVKNKLQVAKLLKKMSTRVMDARDKQIFKKKENGDRVGKTTHSVICEEGGGAECP